MALIASVHDTHANLWSSLRVRPPQGACTVPVIVRFIDGKVVVTGYSDAKAGPETGLKIGDVLAARDGTSVSALVERWSPYYAASNQPTRQRDIARSMLRGDCESRVRVRREGDKADLAVATVALEGAAARAGMTHDLPGETFRLLSKDVAYVKMSGVKLEEAKSYIDRASGTKGLIIDLRPTIAGVRAGRDELLEEALRQILGEDVPPPELQKLMPR